MNTQDRWTREELFTGLPANDADMTSADAEAWHDRAGKFMDRFPEFQPMSLDEWVHEYSDKISDNDYRLASELMQGFSGYGGHA